MAEGERSGRGRSRKHRNSRGKAFFAAVFRFILTILITAGLVFTGAYVYHYWQGNQTSNAPLETGRKIEPETMKVFEGF